MAVPGRTLAVAVHRPLAEQLVAIAGLRAGDRVLELSSGDEELTRRLREHQPAVDLTVEVVGADPPPSPALAAASFDVVLSLLALEPDQGFAATLDEVARVARRARLVVWEEGATHVTALRAAWADAADGAPAPFPTPNPLPALSAGWSRGVLTDVARFDSAEQLWAAMLIEPGLTVPADRADALRERFAHHLAPFTAADGTLRIPVRATVLALG